MNFQDAEIVIQFLPTHWKRSSPLFTSMADSNGRRSYRETFLSSRVRMRHADGIEDCKSLLQEKAQGQLGITPTYQVMDQWGEDHQKTFCVGVYLGNEVVGVGKGRNKREAQQNAAREALSKLK